MRWTSLLAVGAALLLTGSFCLAVEVVTLSPEKETGPGEFVTHVFSVRNDGPAEETLLLSLDVPPTWGLIGVPEGLALAAGAEETLFVTFMVPPGAEASRYEIVLHVVSQGDPLGDRTATAVVTVGPVNNVEIIPPAGGRLPPGGRLSYRVEIVNRGNAQDTLEIRAKSGSGFPIVLSDSLISLTPQERRTVEVEIAVPADATAGRDPLTVEVTSTLYPGVEDLVVVFTTILPPPPSAVGGTLLEVLPARVRWSIEHDALTGALDSDFRFTSTGSVGAGYLSAYLGLSPLYGPTPLEVSTFSVLYRHTPASYAVGDTFSRLTELTSISCRGGRFEYEEDPIALSVIGGGYDEEARFGGLVSLGPDVANLGLAYGEWRDASVRRAAWNLFGECEPLIDWRLRMEGALGVDGALTSRAFLFSTEVDTEGYFLFGEVLSVGTGYPGSRSDEAGVSLSQRLRGEDYSFRASLRHSRDNVDESPLAVTEIADELGLNLSATPLEDGPILTATSEFTWDRDSTQAVQNDTTALTSVSIDQSDPPFPYSLSASVEDQLDGVAGTHFRTLTFSEGFGLSISGFDIFLRLTQSTTTDEVAGGAVSEETDVALRFRTDNALHSATFALENSGDSFAAHLDATMAPLQDVELTLETTWTWDRGGAVPVSVAYRLSLEARFDLPIPFLRTRGRIEGRVYVDRDGDRAFGTGDEPAGGVVVAIAQNEVSTDATGAFRFRPLSEGTYTVEVRQLSSDVTAVRLPTVDLQPGTTVWVDVLLSPLTVVSGTVFDDGDRSGTFDSGEGGFAEVLVLLADEGREVDEAITDFRGGFEFTGVPPGSYVVRIEGGSLPERFEFTTAEETAVEATVGAKPTVTFGGYVKPRTVVVTFQPPTADFVTDLETGAAGEPIVFDGSFSFDFDGEIVLHEWDFDGDGAVDATGAEVTHTFAAPGTYAVRLTVTDDGGNSDTIAYPVTVE